MESMIGFLIFIFGSMIGSFLNVCIVRMPKGESVVTPRSHCVGCQKMIPWYDNIPLISFFFLQGKCRFCKVKISWRYVLVELLTALSFLGFYLYFGLTAVLGPYLVMFAGFVVATFVDIEHRIIPDEITVGGMVVGLGFSLLIPSLHQSSIADLNIAGMVAGGVLFFNLLLSAIYPKVCAELIKQGENSEDVPGIGDVDSKTLDLLILAMIVILALILAAAKMSFSLSPNILSLGFSLAGALIAGGVINLMGLAGDMIFKKESMGGGDVKFMAMVGAFLGWQLAVIAFFIAPFFGAIIGIAVLIRTKKSIIPYGPFLVLGSLIALFFSKQILSWLTSGYSF